MKDDFLFYKFVKPWVVFENSDILYKCLLIGDVCLVLFSCTQQTIYDDMFAIKSSEERIMDKNCLQND